jgi:hypothetical protein
MSLARGAVACSWEMVHLLVRHHDDRFNSLMDHHLPG